MLGSFAPVGFCCGCNRRISAICASPLEGVCYHCYCRCGKPAAASSITLYKRPPADVPPPRVYFEPEKWSPDLLSMPVLGETPLGGIFERYSSPVSWCTFHESISCGCPPSPSGTANMAHLESRAKRGRKAQPGLVTTTIKEQTERLRDRTGWRASVRVLRRDVIVKRILTHGQARVRSEKQMGSKRSAITELTKRALRRMVLVARNIPDLPILITLTYPMDYPTDGVKVKYHLKLFKKWLIYKGIKGFWFLEFQKRGAPHFHLFVDKFIPGLHKEVAEYWYKVVDSGDPKHLSAGTGVETMRELHALAAYAEKFAAGYASKIEQKSVPEHYSSVGRFWGRFGGLEVQERFEASGRLGGGQLELDLETGEVAEDADLPDMSDELRLVGDLYASHRNKLISYGSKVAPVESRHVGYGRRSFTCYGIADAVANNLPRLGKSPEVKQLGRSVLQVPVLSPLAKLAAAEMAIHSCA